MNGQKLNRIFFPAAEKLISYRQTCGHLIYFWVALLELACKGHG